MFRPAARQLLRSSAPRTYPRAANTQRFISTAPPHKTSRSWKNAAVRWGLAGTLLYYYNTASVFADEPAYAVHSPPETRQESETLSTLDQIAAQRQSRSRSAPSQAESAAVATQPMEVAAPDSLEELEEEAGQQAAFNEETGEINWDCPCLGGMAHGPCGEEFREAFSCFVFSKEEPKGVDCIDKFKGMQNCFREHPDIYGAELDDEEGEPSARHGPPSSEQEEKMAGDRTAADGIGKQEHVSAATEQATSGHEATSDANELVPKAWHDSR